MKKLLITLCLIFLSALGCAAEEELNFHLVTYDGNGISLSSVFSPQAKFPGESLKLSNWRPLRNFYTFGGWAESPDATLPDYLPDDIFVEDRDVTLYAIWLEPASLGSISGPCLLSAAPYPYAGVEAYRIFTVTETGYYRFTSTGGSSGSSDPRIIIKDASGYKSTISTGDTSYISGSGYDFVISAELQAGTTYYLEYTESGKPLSINVTYNFHLVTYDGNGISLSSVFSPQIKLPGESLKLSNWRPLRNFYTFGGWAESPDATLPDYLPDATFTEDRDVTLYAIWLEPASLGSISDPCSLSAAPYPYAGVEAYRIFTVAESGYYHFASTGGSSGSSDPRIIIKDASGYKSTISTGDTSYISGSGYDFVITAELQAGTTYYLEYTESGKPLSINVSHNFHLVTYEGNGISLSSIFSPQAKLPGKSLKLSNWRPLRNFYTFGGWAESPDATLPDYLPDDTFTEDRDITLYAIWLEPTSLGTVSGACTLSAAPYPYAGVEAYRIFTVTESGYYHFASTGGSSGSSDPRIIIKDASGYKSTISTGDTSYISGPGYDFVITAELQAGTTYYLEYTESGKPLSVDVLPQYSDPNPFGASSIIPRGMTTLEAYSFANTALDSFFCPESITHIDRNTFADCPNLRKIVISGMNVTIDPAAFAGCTDLLIVAPINSTAHKFALEYGFEFRALPKE